MSDAIKVSLTPDKIRVLPDAEPIETMIIIQNAGATVDQYAVELDQLPTTWYSLSNTSVALFPQDKEEAKLIIHPPKGGAAKAGIYPFSVTVVSRADPSQTSRTEGVLEIGAVAAFELSMSPTKVTGRKGNYTLNLRNGGNADIEVVLEGSDNEESARYGFSPKAPQLAAGQKAQVRLRVKARRSNIAGAKKSIDFTVRGTPSKGEPKAVQGQLNHKPMFRTWRPIRRTLLILVLLALLGVGAYFVFGAASNNTSSVNKGFLNGTLKPKMCQYLHVLCANSTPIIASPTAVPTQPGGNKTPVPPSSFQYIGAFKVFHDHDPTLIGEPAENEVSNHGVATQKTSKGLLLFDRKGGHAFLYSNDGSVWEYYGKETYEVRYPPGS